MMKPELPIPADVDLLDAKSPYYKMPYVYKEYGLHRIGTDEYQWSGPTVTDVLHISVPPGWELVWRSVSEAHQL